MAKSLISRFSGTVRGALWNPDVSPGGTVTFGFNGTPGGLQAVLENLLMGITRTAANPSPTQPAPLPMPAPTLWLIRLMAKECIYDLSIESRYRGFNPSTDRLNLRCLFTT